MLHYPVKCALLVHFEPSKLQLLAVASCVAVVHYKEKLGSVSCFLPELYTLVWKRMQQECAVSAISAFSICTTFQLVFGCRLPSLKLSTKASTLYYCEIDVIPATDYLTSCKFLSVWPTESCLSAHCLKEIYQRRKSASP